MKIKFVSGDILKANSQAQVNPINCVGVMGAGLAKQFKEAYPEMFNDYKKLCNNKALAIGKMHIYRTGLKQPEYLFNVPTKYDYRADSRLKSIRLGMQVIVATTRKLRIKSVAIPKLGCGLGNLKWKDVLPIIKEHTSQAYGCTFHIYGDDII